MNISIKYRVVSTIRHDNIVWSIAFLSVWQQLQGISASLAVSLFYSLIEQTQTVWVCCSCFSHLHHENCKNYVSTFQHLQNAAVHYRVIFAKMDIDMGYKYDNFMTSASQKQEIEELSQIGNWIWNWTKSDSCQVMENGMIKKCYAGEIRI